MSDLKKLLAQIAYEAYAEQTGWKNYQGNPMPAWDALPEAIRDAWDAGARAIVGALAEGLVAEFSPRK
jgi:hypothetical protein